MFEPIINGFVLALGLILPLGPQNIFVFSQGAVQPSLKRAIPVVVTAGLADTFLILLAVGGVSVVLLAAPGVKTAVTWAGVLFLLYMGYLSLRSSFSDNTASSEDIASKAREWTRSRQVRYALSVSLLNPHAILDTVAVIGIAAAAYSGSERTAFTSACVATSWVWFASLAALGSILRRHDSNNRFQPWVARISAVLMWVCAVYLARTALL
ncbi:MAG: LysE family transporter [bacterium]|nr:LysE family transporter [bacterium]